MYGDGEPRVPHGTAHLPQVTLSSSARLDALAVNHYRLQLRLTCGKKVLEAPLSVNVHRDPGYSPCASQFANPGEARGSRQGWVARPEQSLPDFPSG